MLSEEEVKHVAHLARIGLNEEEIEKYQKDLYIMIKEVEKIKDIDLTEDKFIFNTTDNKIDLNNKQPINVEKENLLKNVPSKKGNFIEVPVIINE